jgi:hypothetical protein
MFIFSEGVAIHPEVFEDTHVAKSSGKGAFAVMPTKRDVAEFDTYWRNLFQNVAQLKAAAVTNPWLLDVYHAATGCRPSPSNDCGSNPVTSESFILWQPRTVQYAVQATMTIALLIKQMHTRLCVSPGVCEALVHREQFVDAMSTLSVDFATDFPTFPISSLQNSHSHPISFDGNGDVVLSAEMPIYQVYNHRACEDQSGRFCFVRVSYS